MSTDSRSLRTLGCALTLLAAALVGASSPARAQEEDGSGAPWLQVEVLVFRQLDSSLAGDEAWPSAPDLGYPQDIHILSQPEVPDQSLTAASDSPELLAPEQPFVQLGHGMRALDDAAARIAGSAAYRLLGQFAWRQPAPARGTRSNILLTGGETYADHFELEGSISVTRSRSLQVETRLWLNDFTPLPVPGAQSAGVDLPAVPQPVADLLEPESIEQIATAALRATRSVLLAETRRVRLGEVHYIDHPLFAVLLKLQPYDPAAQPVATDSTPAP